MRISLADLSPATLEYLAEMIERRLQDPEAALGPETWHEAVRRENAERELSLALVDEGMAKPVNLPGTASAVSASLH